MVALLLSVSLMDAFTCDLQKPTGKASSLAWWRPNFSRSSKYKRINLVGLDNHLAKGSPLGKWVHFKSCSREKRNNENEPFSELMSYYFPELSPLR